MSGSLETSLAFVLFIPLFCIVGALYCLFPRQPRGIWRFVADVAVLISAAALSIVAMRWAFRAATGVGGPIWRQILATLLVYSAFLGMIGVAVVIRALWVRRIYRRSKTFP